jgi:SAM-dependent methyltransferase/uncharacterized protein YbaR (Trm112 family)
MVSPSLLEILRCPLCSGELDGTLSCAGCKRKFAVANGIPLLAPGGAETESEVSGWLRLAEQEGWRRENDEVDAVLPYVNRELGWDSAVWRGNAHSFSVLLERFVRPGMLVLEVGAAKCWAAPHLLARGCRYVGTDILVDDQIGLGRGAFYAARSAPFDRVQADAEHLPFADESFDLTFCVASLHHALDLDRMLGEMARVTRHGGVVAALSEATRPLWSRRHAPAQEPERKLGIHEHAHSLLRYARAFRGAGLRLCVVETADGFTGLERRPLPRLVFRIPGAKLAATLVAHGFVTYGGISLYATRAS